MGRRVKLPKCYATLPLPLVHPVRTMEDWLRIQSRSPIQWAYTRHAVLAISLFWRTVLPGRDSLPSQSYSYTWG
jgi:hypothetical protein